MKPNLILASASLTRKQILEQTGIDFSVIPSYLDEDALKTEFTHLPPKDLAVKLAREKAKQISTKHPNSWVLGADQILVFEGKIYNKAQSKPEAEQILRQLRGKKHELVSALVIYYNQRCVWECFDTASLYVRQFSEQFLQSYVNRVSERLLQAVGCYQLEKGGIQLFEKIEGDYFTVLGLPLLPLLNSLRNLKIIDS